MLWAVVDLFLHLSVVRGKTENKSERAAGLKVSRSLGTEPGTHVLWSRFCGHADRFVSSVVSDYGVHCSLCWIRNTEAQELGQSHWPCQLSQPRECLGGGIFLLVST